MEKRLRREARVSVDTVLCVPDFTSVMVCQSSFRVCLAVLSEVIFAGADYSTGSGLWLIAILPWARKRVSRVRDNLASINGIHDAFR